jgi:pectinesterase
MRQKICIATLFLFAAALFAQTNLFIAADGSAPFKSVQEAITAVPSGSATNPVVIHIKAGTYKELIYVQREKRFLKLVGDDAEKTILSYGLYASMTNSDAKPLGTFNTASTTIDADGFLAENITFENSAGLRGEPALAMRVDGDRAVFKHCRFIGWQDTVLLNRGRQYFNDCYICGDVDFIFGGATAWFEKCHIHARGDGFLTSASTPNDAPYGFVFSNCKITGEKPDTRVYLGRPWGIYASTIFLNTEMSGVVRHEGWSEWKKPKKHITARYAEFNSTGPAATPDKRVPWAKQLSKTEADKITVKTVLGGTDGWDPAQSKM